MRGSAAFRTGAAPGGALAPRWTQRRLWRAARATPSLDLNFADSKSLVDSVTGQSLVTFTRASNATFVGSDGVLRTAVSDVPRFDHNPLTGESLGLLVEEARTNLFLRSEEFDNAAWNSFAGARSVTANSITAPDSTTTADRITADGTNNPHFVSQSVTVTNVSHSCSVFAKAGTSSTLAIRAFSALGGTFVFFNLSNGTVGTSGSGGVGSIVAYPNGWYRCIMNFTPLTATGSIGFYIDDTANNTSSGTLHLWGAQLEVGAFPTSYIPTTSATATRSADVASIGSFNGPVGCLFAQFSNPASGSRGIASVNDNSANSRIELRTSGTDPFLTVINGGTTQADIDAGAISANTVTKLSGRVAANNFGASIAGGTEVLDTSGSVPTVTQLQIGRDQAGNYLNGRLARLAVWTQPLNILQALTQ